MIDVSFLPNRKKDEQTISLLRRHWIVVAKILAIFLVGAVLPLAVYFIVLADFSSLLQHEILAPLIALFVSFYYLGLWLFTFQEIVDYYLDTWILTTERVVDVEQFGLFRRETTECHLGQVVDVTSEIKGMLQTFLKFGNVTVQTAGAKGQLVFKQVSRPEEVRQLVLKLVDEAQQRNKLSTPST